MPQEEAVTCGCGEHATEKDHLREEFAAVRRRLACYKITYYQPELLPVAAGNLLTVPDSQYDSMETRYLDLCALLEEPNTLSHQGQVGRADGINGTGMMEVDPEHPDVQDAIAWAVLTFGHRTGKRKKRG